MNKMLKNIPNSKCAPTPNASSQETFLDLIKCMSGFRQTSWREFLVTPMCTQTETLKHEHLYKLGWLAALNVEYLVFKVTGSIQGSELPISVSFIEIGWCCIPEGEHLKLAAAEWN